MRLSNSLLRFASVRRRTGLRSWSFGTGAIAVSLLLGGCGGAASSSPKVDVQLGDFNVKLSKTTVKAGKIVVTAKNKGGMEHEVVVLKMRLAELPMNADGSVNEEKISENVKMGEIEHVGGGASKQHTFDLQPGTYSMICNLNTKLSDGEMAMHYPRGMKAELIVN